MSSGRGNSSDEEGDIPRSRFKLLGKKGEGTKRESFYLAVKKEKPVVHVSEY